MVLNRQRFKNIIEHWITKIFHNGSTGSYCLENYSLHIFSDASQSSYDACAYSIVGNQSVLVTARNRDSLLKWITLPKLESVGSVLGGRIAKRLISNLNLLQQI